MPLLQYLNVSTKLVIRAACNTVIESLPLHVAHDKFCCLLLEERLPLSVAGVPLSIDDLLAFGVSLAPVWSYFADRPLMTPRFSAASSSSFKKIAPAISYLRLNRMISSQVSRPVGIRNRGEMIALRALDAFLRGGGRGHFRLRVAVVH
jgi:hypothetical protein